MSSKSGGGGGLLREIKAFLACFKPQDMENGGYREHPEPDSRPQHGGSPTRRKEKDNKPLPENVLSPRQRRRLKNLATHAKEAVSRRFEEGTRRSSFRFWRILVTTAVLSSLLSYTIDQVTWMMGIARTKFTNTSSYPNLLMVIVFNVTVCLIGRLVVRTTVEAEGSGFPEVKAMLFGKVMLNFLTMRVLVVKAIALALGVGAGLPLGKEGPNVHMAACISRTLGSDFYERGRSRASVAGVHLLLAACAVGVGSSFSAPIGGVVFSLELVMPQVFDYIGYSGCFLSAVTGSICFAFYRTWTAGSTGLLPLMSSNVLPDEGTNSPYPSLMLLLYILLGVICGILGGLWIRLHAKVVGMMKRWRLRGSQTSANQGPGQSSLYESLLGREKSTVQHGKSSWSAMTTSFVSAANKAMQWRDLFQITVVVVVNTVLAAALPLLEGRPQPLLLSTLFDKDLIMDESSWSLGFIGPTATLVLCFLMKWTTTIFALSLPSPAGVVAPTMIIGGLLGRVIGSLLPTDLVDALLMPSTGEQVVTDDLRGAFLARLAIVGAAAFCAAVCRAFAMAITVFEVLALPNAILPLCSASLAAIFVANRIALPYFDTNLVGRGLGGISALTHTKKAMEPAFNVMRRVDMRKDCLEQITTPNEMQQLLEDSNEDHFPIIQHVDQHWSDEGVAALLKGSISRPDLEQLAGHFAKGNQDREVDLFDPTVTRPLDRSVPLVQCVPMHVPPETHVQDVYLLMKITNEPVVYVTSDNCLLGVINFKELLGHKL